MGYHARVLADSISELGIRLTTLEVTMPRIVLAEFNTHRMFSRSSASSRAIPVEKRIAAIAEDPFVPDAFGKNQKGMQAAETLEEEQERRAREDWMDAAGDAVKHARVQASLGVHKQLANRLIEPYSWHTVIVTATDWDNFLNLRVNPMAQPEIEKPARLMLDQMRGAVGASQPKLLPSGQWHMPFLDADEVSSIVHHGLDPKKVSIARCARVSYNTHAGIRDPAEDEGLFGRLVAPGHMAPLEHAARPMKLWEMDAYQQWEFVVQTDEGRRTIRSRWEPEKFLQRVGHSAVELVTDVKPRITWYCGNFNGWIQYRKLIEHEAVFQPAQDS